ncbi:hypothetical protein V1477_021165 [Vespula maculifrons]|uniref:Guanylate cyclase domain-containing protein n=1 Tax=Vespula maculifrons TaxID=7453 RepID=A0ABD2AGY4_VESMC
MYYNSDIAKFGSFAINIAYWKNSFRPSLKQVRIRRLVITHDRYTIVRLSYVVIMDISGYTVLSDINKALSGVLLVPQPPKE